MASDSVPVACAKCGNDKFSRIGDLRPDDPIVCRVCRAISTYAQAHQEGLKRKRDLAEKRGRDVVK